MPNQISEETITALGGRPDFDVATPIIAQGPFVGLLKGTEEHRAVGVNLAFSDDERSPTGTVVMFIHVSGDGGAFYFAPSGEPVVDNAVHTIAYEGKWLTTYMSGQEATLTIRPLRCTDSVWIGEYLSIDELMQRL
jgi:hypothetical protein